MKRLTLLLSLALALASILWLLPSALAAEPGLIPDDCVDFVTMSWDHYTLCFIEKIQASEDYATWTYAVQATGNEPTSGDTGPECLYAMSHWSLDFCETFFDHINPDDGDIYTIPTTYLSSEDKEFIGREGITYTIDLQGESQVPAYRRLKFESTRDPLGDEGYSGVDLFQFTIPSKNIATGDVPVGLKAGNTQYSDWILGPVFEEGACTGAVIVESCEKPEAVCGLGLEARSKSLIGWVLDLLSLK